MTISSYDSLIASAASGKRQDRHFSKTLLTNAIGQAVSLWGLDSAPPAGAGGSSLVARTCDNSVAGALSFATPTAPDQLYLTSGFVWGTASNLGSLVLYDRIADISGIDLSSGSPQSVTMSALPRYASGQGVQMFLEVTTVLTGLAPVVTINYIDQSGAAGSATVTAVAAQSVNRLLYTGFTWVPLAAGDSGVQKVTSISISSPATSGVARLVFAMPMATFPLLSAGTVVERDFVTQVPRLPQIIDNACLGFLVVGGSATAGTVTGSLTAIAG